MTVKATRSSQGGVVMIVCLLVLLLTGLLAASVYEGNLMQLRMADNEEVKSREMQAALALADAILAYPQNFPLHSQPGDSLCHAGGTDELCSEGVVAVAQGIVGADEHFIFSVMRRAPAQISLPAMAEDRASSGRYYRGALFEIRVSGDGSRGGIRLAQGVMRRQLVAGY